MEASTLCALMLKARKVFANEQTFLSFPVSPLPYSPRQLDFFDQSSGAALLQSIHFRKAFSDLVDLVPTGEAWQPSDEARLSETYQAVLDGAELAVSSRSPEEEVQFQAARAVLRTDDHDSEQLIAYRRCRDAYLLAEQRYTAARLTADAGEAQEKLQWLQTTGPALQRELADLLQSWLLDGFKEQVERAQVQVATLGARSPALTWADWRSRYNPELDALNDALDGTSVMPSGFSPSNAIAPEAWRSFSLTPSEVSALLQEAPPAWLSTMLGATPPHGTQSISFEFSSAAIVRPWFDADLFKARFWRFHQADRQISDGKTPATGECPAYVAALVFARNVVVTGAGATAPSTGAGGFDSGFHLIQRDALVRAKIRKLAITTLDEAAPDRLETPPHILLRRRMAIQPRAFGAAHGIGALKPSFAASALVAEAGVSAVHAAAPPAPTRAPTEARSLSQFIRLKIDRAADRVLLDPAIVMTPVTPPAATPAPAAPPAPSPDTVYVLAFICKPLPQCPNPDPALQW